jgi:serine/threonine protein kinase
MAGISPPATPDRLGPFRIEGVLGEGAMGVVYRAVREDDGSTVALKVLRPELAGDETYRRRFVHEARAAAEVASAHLVPILEAGEIEGCPYLAVAFVEGETLERRIRERGALATGDAVGVAADLSSALDALHEAGLVHRDVKPSNVLLTTDRSALLTDFGLAKGSAYTVLTKRGQVLGTVDYLAPEIIRGEPATPASDLYGLGCVVYDCLAGKPPFEGRGLFEVGLAHLEQEPQAPCEGPLGWAVLQALEKDPARRPPTAVAYASMLRVALWEQP